MALSFTISNENWLCTTNNAIHSTEHKCTHKTHSKIARTNFTYSYTPTLCVQWQIDQTRCQATASVCSAATAHSQYSKCVSHTPQVEKNFYFFFCCRFCLDLIKNVFTHQRYKSVANFRMRRHSAFYVSEGQIYFLLKSIQCVRECMCAHIQLDS